MRAAGPFLLFAGIAGALFGLSYSAFVMLREWTPFVDEAIAVQGPSTVRVSAKAARQYWADIELSGTAPRKPIDYDIPLKMTVAAAPSPALRSADLHIDANAPLPACKGKGLPEPNTQCGGIELSGPARDRIAMHVRVPPVTATDTGELAFAIDIGPNGRGDVTLESAKIIVYRSSREEVIAGLVGAFAGLVLAGIAFKLAARRG